MLKKSVYIFFAFVLLLAPVNIFAENEIATTTESTTTPTVTKSPQQLRETLKERKDEAKEEFKEAKAGLKEKMSAAREKLKERIATIKDEKKKVIVENIDTKIQNINERRTQQMLEHLAKISSVLERVKLKMTELGGQGKDTTSLSASILAAQTAIDKAKAAVDAQSLKEYNASITTDASLKNAITTVLNQFKKDIKSAFELVLAAKKAVISARKEARILSGEESAGPAISPTVTVAPTATPTL